MKALGFLLAADLNGEWTLLKSGTPTDLRREFKMLVTDDSQHDFTQLYYTSMRGEMKIKRWRKRAAGGEVIKAPSIVAEEPAQEEAYTGEDIIIETPKKRGRGRPRKTDI